MRTAIRFSRTLTVLTLLLASTWTLQGCKWIRNWLNSSNPSQSPKPEIPRVPDPKDLHLPQQRILVLNGATDPQKIASALQVTVAAQCGCGDQQYVLLTDPLLDQFQFDKSGPDGNYVGQLPAGKGGGSVPLNGLTDLGLNYRLEKDTTYGNREKFSFVLPAGPHNSNEAPLVIGVLDTGIAKDQLPERYRWKNPGADCDEFKGDGRNFIANNTEPWDDDRQWHGSAVTALLLNQLQTNEYANRNVQIMPLKVLDNTGWGTVFHTMCALQFARHYGVKLLNLSLGSYAPLDDAPLSPLKNLMRQMSTEGVTFVVAAGNPSPSADSRATVPGGTSATVRDLNIRKVNTFYPAVWSARTVDGTDNLTDNGIIPVTTLSPGPASSLSPCQNYGPQHVRLGVTGDMGGCSFAVPNYGGQQGTSFATPVATGRVARVLFDTRGASPALTRQQLIDHVSRADAPTHPYIMYDKRVDP